MNPKTAASRLVMCLLCAMVVLPMAGCSHPLDHITLPSVMCGSSPAIPQDVADAASSGDLSDEQWDQVVAASSSDEDREWFGSVLYSVLYPDQVATLAWRLSASYPWPLTPPASYFSRILALGELLGAATRSTCAPLRADYVSDVVGVIELSSSPLPVAMSMVLSHGQYDTAFALKIATDIHQYASTKGFSWEKVSGEPNQIHMIADDGSWRIDAMAGVMAMLATAPDAAQEFFTTGDILRMPDYDIPFNSRLYDLVTQHSWDTYSDGGAGLGAAVESATTTYRTFDSRGQTSASIATQVFTLAGWRTNKDDDWTLPAAMRSPMARIVASYMPDLLTASDYPATIADFSSGLYQNNDYFPGFPAGAKFTHKDMMAILHTLGEDVDNVKTLGMGWAIAATAYLAFDLSSSYPDAQQKATLVTSDYSDDGEGLFMNSLIPCAAVLGDIVDAASGVPSGDTIYRIQLTSGILQFASTLPLMDLGTRVQEGTMADWAFGVAQSFAMDHMGDDMVMSDNNNDGVRRTSTYWFFQVFYGLGFWDQDVIDAINADWTGPSPYTGPPDDAFTDSTRSKFDHDSDSFSQWYVWESWISLMLDKAAVVFKVDR